MELSRPLCKPHPGKRMWPFRVAGKLPSCHPSMFRGWQTTCQVDLSQRSKNGMEAPAGSCRTGVSRQLGPFPHATPSGKTAVFVLCKLAPRNVQLQHARWMSNSEWRRKKDRYARQAKEEGLRSRAAYKLKQMNKKSRILAPGMTVVELGAAPGGWTVVATELVNASTKVPWTTPSKPGAAPHESAIAGSRNEDDRSQARPAISSDAVESSVGGRRKTRGPGRVICCDLLSMTPVRGATFIQGDFRLAATQRKVLLATESGSVDSVLSDMAPNTCGDAAVDHFRIMELARQALSFSLLVLRHGGSFLVKIFNGSELHEFLAEVKLHFKDVKILKPDSSRSASSECYVYATQRVAPRQGHAKGDAPPAEAKQD